MTLNDILNIAYDFYSRNDNVLTTVLYTLSLSVVDVDVFFCFEDKCTTNERFRYCYFILRSKVCAHTIKAMGKFTTVACRISSRLKRSNKSQMG